jgi:hypothetical protein
MRITAQMANPCINKVLLLKCDNHKSCALPGACMWKKEIPPDSLTADPNSFILRLQLLNNNKSGDKPHRNLIKRVALCLSDSSPSNAIRCKASLVQR